MRRYAPIVAVVVVAVVALHAPVVAPLVAVVALHRLAEEMIATLLMRAHRPLQQEDMKPDKAFC